MPPDPPDAPGERPTEDRFALLSTWRWVVPAAIAAGLLGAIAFDGAAGRATCRWGAVALAVLWVIGRVARLELVVDGSGYRVERLGKARLAVKWDEVVRARAVPAEQAMYVDCGDPSRNLLLPTRRGFGFRFERQDALYVRVARALGDRLQIVTRLEEKVVEP